MWASELRLCHRVNGIIGVYKTWVAVVTQGFTLPYGSAVTAAPPCHGRRASLTLQAVGFRLYLTPDSSRNS